MHRWDLDVRGVEATDQRSSKSIPMTKLNGDAWVIFRGDKIIISGNLIEALIPTTLLQRLSSCSCVVTTSRVFYSSPPSLVRILLSGFCSNRQNISTQSPAYRHSFNDHHTLFSPSTCLTLSRPHRTHASSLALSPFPPLTMST